MVLYLKLKKANNKKKYAIQSNKTKKRSRFFPSYAKDNIYNFNKMFVYFIAINLLFDLKNFQALDIECI